MSGRRNRHRRVPLALVVAVAGGCYSEGGVVSSRAGDAARDRHADAITYDGPPGPPRDGSADGPRDAARDAVFGADAKDGRSDAVESGHRDTAVDAAADEGAGRADASVDGDVWVPVDLHTHSDQCDGTRHTLPEMANLASGAGIRVASVLLWGNWKDDLPLLTGTDDPASSADRILHVDIEISGFQAATGGHLLLLGLPHESLPAVWPDPYLYQGSSGVPILSTEFGRFAALRGIAHAWTWPPSGAFPAPPLGCCMALELPVHVARGAVDFVGTEYDFEDPEKAGAVGVWERLLQSGFKLPFVPASDWSCLQTRIGAVRSRVLVSGTVSYPAVLAAVKAGRVVAVVGESESELDVRIGNHRIGDTLDVAAGKPIDVEIDTDQRVAGTLRLIANGQIVHEEALPAGRQTRRVKVQLSGSAWIRATIPGVATSPIYVTVDGAPIRPSADAPCYFMQYIDHLSNLVATRAVDMGVDEQAALAAYAEARNIFATRFAEANGRACP